MAGDPVEVTFLGADPPEPPAEPPTPRTRARATRQRVGVALAAAGALAAGVLVARGVAGDPAPVPSPVATRSGPPVTGRVLPPPIPLPTWSTVQSGPAGHPFPPQ